MAENLSGWGNGNSSFVSWIRENRGDEEISRILADHGFTSQLSQSFVDMKSPECEAMLAHMNYGQRCLFQRLVKLASGSSSGQHGSSKPSTSKSAYAGAVDKAEKVAVGMLQLVHVTASSCYS